MEKEAAGIRFQTRDEELRMENLMHHVNEQTLMEEHRKQSRRKATGIDGVTKDEYNVNVEKNLKELVERMKRFSYRPMPVRRTYIPKANGKQRPLGIPAYEDKLVQGVMARLLNEVYEVRFLDCSYGFQKGKSCHDVVRYINQTVMTKKVNYVLEADIKGFFRQCKSRMADEIPEFRHSRPKVSPVREAVSDCRGDGGRSISGE